MAVREVGKRLKIKDGPVTLTAFLDADEKIAFSNGFFGCRISPEDLRTVLDELAPARLNDAGATGARQPDRTGYKAALASSRTVSEDNGGAEGAPDERRPAIPTGCGPAPAGTIRQASGAPSAPSGSRIPEPEGRAVEVLAHVEETLDAHGARKTDAAGVALNAYARLNAFLVGGSAVLLEGSSTPEADEGSDEAIVSWFVKTATEALASNIIDAAARELVSFEGGAASDEEWQDMIEAGSPTRDQALVEARAVLAAAVRAALAASPVSGEAEGQRGVSAGGSGWPPHSGVHVGPGTLGVLPGRSAPVVDETGLCYASGPCDCGKQHKGEHPTLRSLLERAREVIRRGEIRLDADCSPPSPLVREIDAALARAAAADVPGETGSAWFDEATIRMEEAGQKLLHASEDQSSHFYETLLRAALAVPLPKEETA